MNNAELINELRYCFATHRTVIPLYVWLELEARLPKEGEWISNYDGFDYDVRCSVCGEEALIKEGGSHDHAYSRYCPNCGAKMKGEQE